MENKNNNQVEEGRVMTKYDKKMQKRNEEAIKAKKRKMAVRGTAIAVVAVCVVLAVFMIISSVGKNISYIKVDNESISKEEFNFYYMRTVNYYGNMYSSYGYLDTSVALDEQQYSGNLTWKDYFEQLATDEIVRVKALIKDSEKNDFDTSGLEEEYEKTIEAFKEDAKANEVSESEYFDSMFGGSEKKVEKYLKEYLLAEMWYEKIEADNAVTDEEVEEYYQENKDSYDCVDYYAIEVTPQGIDLETCTEEEYNSAMIAAHEEATSKVKVVEKEGTHEEYAESSDMSEALSEWLYDEARVEGETAVVDDNDNSTIYAVKFVKRFRDERPTANIRAAITSSEDVEADAILKEWEEGDKTEDSFIELVNKYTEDTSVTDGLYEGVTRVGMEVEELTDWIFDEKRVAGDTKAVTTDEGYKYVVYYKGTNDPDYMFAIKETMLNERLTEYESSITDVIEVADPNGVLKYLEAAGE